MTLKSSWSDGDSKRGEKEIEDDVERSSSHEYSEGKDEEVYYAESVENYDSRAAIIFSRASIAS
jgi:hypothetical protein